MRKAYRCTILKWPNFEMIYPGEKRSKAVFLAWYDGQQAGYDIPWIDYRAIRAPEFDALARETEGMHPWCLGWRQDGERWGCLDDTGKHPLPIS